MIHENYMVIVTHESRAGDLVRDAPRDTWYLVRVRVPTYENRSNCRSSNRRDCLLVPSLITLSFPDRAAPDHVEKCLHVSSGNVPLSARSGAEERVSSVANESREDSVRSHERYDTFVATFARSLESRRYLSRSVSSVSAARLWFLARGYAIWHSGRVR